MQEIPSNDRDFFAIVMLHVNGYGLWEYIALVSNVIIPCINCLILKTLTDIDWCDRSDFAAIEELLPQDVSHWS